MSKWDNLSQGKVRLILTAILLVIGFVIFRLESIGADKLKKQIYKDYSDDIVEVICYLENTQPEDEDPNYDSAIKSAWKIYDMINEGDK